MLGERAGTVERTVTGSVSSRGFATSRRSTSSKPGADAADAAYRVRTRGLRDHRRRNRGRPRRARLRGGRPRARSGARAPRAPRGRARRPLPPRRRAGGRPLLQGRGPRAHRSPAARAGGSTGPGPTCTTTRTAGAPGTLSSTTPSTPGTSAPPPGASGSWSSTGPSTGCRSTSATGASATGSSTTWTGRSRASGSGERPSRCGRTATGTSCASARGRSSKRLCGRPNSATSICTAPRWTRSSSCTPRTAAPTGGCRRSSTAGSIRARCPTPSGTGPSRTRERFEEGFPADYICEAVDQTRGWFYTLHAISTLVSDSVSFRNCICLGHIVDKDGKKMSKSVGNVDRPVGRLRRSRRGPAPLVPLRPGSRPERRSGSRIDLVREVVQTFINTWWNTYAFFVLYARLDEVDVTADVPLARRRRDRPLDPRPPPAHRRDGDRGPWTPTTPRARAGPSKTSSTSSATGTCGATAGASGRRRRGRTSSPPTSPSTSASTRRTG